MFGLRVADAKILKDSFTAISTLVDEATFNIDAEGISLRAMDPSRVAMVDFVMGKAVFDEYTSSEDLKVCLDISELLKLVKRAGKDESVELVLEETGRLKILIRGRYARTFDMPTLEAAEEEIPTPKIAFDARVTLTTDGLRQALEDVVLVSDHVRIQADQHGVLMKGKGDLMSAEIELKKESDALLEIHTKEPSKAAFSLSYLSDIVKAAAPTSDIVTLEFSKDMPVRLDFKQRHEGKLTYYLAPRIEVE